MFVPAISGADPNIMTINCDMSGVYITSDGGDTWKPFESFPFSNTQRVLVAPDDDNTIYVSTFGGSVFKGPAAGQ